MEYRKLGNTDLELSVITHGAFAIGGNMWGGNEKQDSINSIHASLDHGVTSIDTAPFYGFGLSEEMIGEAIKGKDRSKIQLLTNALLKTAELFFMMRCNYNRKDCRSRHFCMLCRDMKR